MDSAQNLLFSMISNIKRDCLPDVFAVVHMEDLNHMIGKRKKDGFPWDLERSYFKLTINDDFIVTIEIETDFVSVVGSPSLNLTIGIRDPIGKFEYRVQSHATLTRVVRLFNVCYLHDTGTNLLNDLWTEKENVDHNMKKDNEFYDMNIKLPNGFEWDITAKSNTEVEVKCNNKLKIKLRSNYHIGNDNFDFTWYDGENIYTYPAESPTASWKHCESVLGDMLRMLELPKMVQSKLQFWLTMEKLTNVFIIQHSFIERI